MVLGAFGLLYILAKMLLRTLRYTEEIKFHIFEGTLQTHLCYTIMMMMVIHIRVWPS